MGMAPSGGIEFAWPADGRPGRGLPRPREFGTNPDTRGLGRPRSRVTCEARTARHGQRLLRRVKANERIGRPKADCFAPGKSNVRHHGQPMRIRLQRLLGFLMMLLGPLLILGSPWIVLSSRMLHGQVYHEGWACRPGVTCLWFSELNMSAAFGWFAVWSVAGAIALLVGLWLYRTARFHKI